MPEPASASNSESYPAAVVPLLQYADVPARHGIIFEATPGGVLITIPVPFWQRVAMVTASGGIVLIAFMIHPLVAFVLILIGVGIAVIRRRIGKPLIIEVTSDLVRFTNVNPTRPEMDRAIPRQDVYEVKFVRHSGCLVVHAHRQEMFELALSRDVALMTWLADTIREALWPKAAGVESPP